MRMLIYLAVALLGLLLVLLGVLGILGSRLPETHVASAGVEVAAAPQQVFDWLANVEDMPSWVPEITRVERLPDQDGRPVHRQHMGRNSFVTEGTVVDPPRRIKREITDVNGPFTGSWDHVIEDLGNGRVRVTVTETGTIRQAIPRAIMKYFVGEDVYLRKFLASLEKKAAS